LQLANCTSPSEAQGARILGETMVGTTGGKVVVILMVNWLFLWFKISYQTSSEKLIVH